MESLVFDPWLKFNSSAWWPAAGPLKVKLILLKNSYRVQEIQKLAIQCTLHVWIVQEDSIYRVNK